jgi:hypothetical protein
VGVSVGAGLVTATASGVIVGAEALVASSVIASFGLRELHALKKIPDKRIMTNHRLTFSIIVALFLSTAPAFLTIILLRCINDRRWELAGPGLK